MEQNKKEYYDKKSEWYFARFLVLLVIAIVCRCIDFVVCYATFAMVAFVCFVLAIHFDNKSNKQK